jgi:tRNA1Val (adenine37-N6)-methyltransferase
MGPWTEDHFFDGAIRIRQERKGYRFSIDAVIVASRVIPKAGETVVDLGTGCGIIPLMLAHRHTQIHIIGVEIQNELAELAAFNCHQNQLNHRIEVLNADMRTLQPDRLNGMVDWVVCNPPYRRPHSGKVNPDVQRAVARHEIDINLPQFVQSAGRLLRAGGRLVTIYPAERLVDLLCEMRSQYIEPKWLQMVHSRAIESAKLVLVQGTKEGRPGLKISVPLVIYDASGSYTCEVAALMRP